MNAVRSSVVVAGTTPDYIDWIRTEAPGAAVFLTDPRLRSGAAEPDPAPWEEVLCDLSDHERAQRTLREHLDRWGIRPAGMACYDCESLDLAALLAERLGLPFASRGAVARSRDKRRSKRLWKEHGLPCPEARPIRRAEDLVAFRNERGEAVVLKPLRGTGSELVFLCDSEDECRRAAATVLDGVRLRPALGGAVAEERIRGTEYSCDFTVSGDDVRLLRLTRKVALPGGPFGETTGYLLCPRMPERQDRADFSETLRRSAAALGIANGFCMIDFIVRDGIPVLLELAPRPGGDCLPQLLRAARGVDVLLEELRFARGFPVRGEWREGGPFFLGLRLIARTGGVLRGISTDLLQRDRRVLEIGGLREPGHRIVLPPEDYDSRILGWAVARLDDGDPEEQAAELASLWSAEVGG